MNDTYGDLTREELAAAREQAKPCLTCGLLATVDPILHEQRYGHAPVIADGTGRLRWSADALSWIADEPPQLGIPYAFIDPETGAATCPACGKVIAEEHDATGEQTTVNYPDHYVAEHQPSLAAQPCPWCGTVGCTGDPCDYSRYDTDN